MEGRPRQGQTKSASTVWMCDVDYQCATFRQAPIGAPQSPSVRHWNLVPTAWGDYTILGVTETLQVDKMREHQYDRPYTADLF